MSKSWLKFGLIFLISLFFFACTSTSLQQQKNIPPQIESAQRVVALTSLTADITERLAPDKLVGISGTSLHANDDRFKAIERVSLGQNPPNLEKIIALKPDLVITAEGLFPQVTSKLNELGIDTLDGKVNSWERLQSITKTLAELLAADPQELLDEYQTFIDDSTESRPATLIMINNKPILSPNQNSWAGDLLKQFNSENITASIQGESSFFGGYITLSPEIILQKNPELILVVNAEGDVLNEFKSDPFWKEIAATQSDRVYSFDYYGLINPGSIAKIKQTCSKLKQVLQE